MTVRIIVGDALAKLREMPDESVHCAVTSPPYWGLRDYGVEPSVWGGDPACAHDFEERRWYTEQSAAKSSGSVEAFSKPGEANAQRLKDARRRTDGLCRHCGAWRGALGLEPTPELFVDHMVEVFREVRRVLRSDGTLWLNMGDSYASGGGAGEQGRSGDRFERAHSQKYLGVNRGARTGTNAGKHRRADETVVCPPAQPNRAWISGLKPKDLVGVPWMLAFALRSDGWWLRQDIIWHKPNPMPESVTDRCTKAHEYVFMLTKSERYYFDQEEILEQASSAEEIKWSDGGGGIHSGESHVGRRTKVFRAGAANKTRKPAGLRDVPGASQTDPNGGVAGSVPWSGVKRNKRSVWTVTTISFPGAHFATFPPALIEPCILAGCPKGGTVLDPFGGAGTTGMVADRSGRDAVLIELNPKYAEMAQRRIEGDGGLFAKVAAE